MLSLCRPIWAGAKRSGKNSPLEASGCTIKFTPAKKTTDRLLTEALPPVITALKTRDLIDQWFFIRYRDSDYHLRVRLHLQDSRNAGLVAGLVAKQLQPYEEGGLIWKVQLDTYIREVNRYGANSIAICESLFHHDSKSIVEFLANTLPEADSDLRWAWGLKSIDRLLAQFQFDAPRKIQLMDTLRSGFAREFEAGKATRNAISKKYRQHYPLLEAVLHSRHPLSESIDPIIDRRDQQIHSLCQQLLALEAANELTLPLDQLLASLIHMLLNRLIPDNQRKHEMVLYEFLFRYYKSSEARKKAA